MWDNELHVNERRDILTNLFMFGDSDDALCRWCGLDGTTERISITPTKVIKPVLFITKLDLEYYHEYYTNWKDVNAKLTKDEKQLPKAERKVLRHKYKQRDRDENRKIDVDFKQGWVNLNKFDWALNVVN